MKKIKIIYWVSTALFALMMLATAIPGLIAPEASIEGFKSLGYPAYLVPFLGIAKILGVIAIFVPGYARVKEWAYAGLIFDVIGAVYSIMALGAPAANWLPVCLPAVLGFVSYIYYHKKTKTNTLSLHLQHS